MSFTYDLSILIPTYNGCHRIGHLLSSLDSKGYTTCSFVEIIVGNNSSSDRTMELLDSLSPAFKIIHNLSNLGVQGNIVKLMENAQGKYIWLLGDDDVVQASAASILERLNQSIYPRMFVSSEEYEALTTGRDRQFFSTMPFGFISSTIQPNTENILKDTIAFSCGKYSQHSSSHFFARFKFFLLFGPEFLSPLPSISELCHRYETGSSRPSLKNYCSALLSPWRISSGTIYWFYAYKKAKVTSGLELVADCIVKSYRGFYFKEIQSNPFYKFLYWGSQIPFSFIKVFSKNRYAPAIQGQARRRYIFQDLKSLIFRFFPSVLEGLEYEIFQLSRFTEALHAFVFRQRPFR
jgi:glycosyltransferase involved in cell wall biosynthesis